MELVCRNLCSGLSEQGLPSLAFSTLPGSEGNVYRK